MAQSAPVASIYTSTSVRPSNSQIGRSALAKRAPSHRSFPRPIICKAPQPQDIHAYSAATRLTAPFNQLSSTAHDLFDFWSRRQCKVHAWVLERSVCVDITPDLGTDSALRELQLPGNLRNLREKPANCRPPRSFSTDCLRFDDHFQYCFGFQSR